MTVPHAEHYDSLETQANAARLGTWVFLGSELLLFSGLFALYGGYRAGYPHAFAEAAGHTDLAIGTVGTFVLLSGSFLVVLGVDATRHDHTRRAAWYLTGGPAMGCAFMALKLAEYVKHVEEGITPTGGAGVPDPPAGGHQIFWTVYYAATGLHMIHVAVGVAVLVSMAWMCRTRRVDRHRAYVVENGANYWHLVDMVWLFLWPMFYLMR